MSIYDLPIGLCCGNIGALTFMMEAFEIDPISAAYALERGANEMDIIGDKMYMVWNDCCDRDTHLTLDVMKNCSKEFILERLNYEKGYGKRIDRTVVPNN